MNVTLYNYSGDRRQLSKYLGTAIATVTILAITDTTNIIRPTIIIDTRAFNFNYVYIPDFGRYYYVDNIQLLNGQRIALQLSCDVLMSHANTIRSSQCIADRSSSHVNVHLVDRTIPSRDDARIYVRKMAATPFTTTTYVLQVAGR